VRPLRLATEAEAPRDEQRAADDLSLLLIRAAQRLLARTGAAAVVVLGRGGERGAGRALAVAAHGEPPLLPSPALLAALAGEPGALDLGRPDAPEAAREAARAGWGAAAPVGRDGASALAALLLRGPEDPPGAVRPRTLAALEAAARRLESPAAASAAAARLSRLDAAVQRLDRLAALGDLLAEVAHEVRNPLVSVKTFLQLLPDRLDDPEFRERFHGLVSDEMRRLERLLDAVLSHARPRRRARVEATSDLRAAAEAVLALVGHRALERSVALELEGPGGELRAPMPDDELRQVILNLVLNAIDATPSGRRVRVVLRRARGGAPELGVEDEGAGVPAELRARIFEPFYSTRTDRPGGLGLAISRRLVEQSGGTLRVLDREGGGARFRARWPSP
jgi:signal transduction histidine kinase